MPFEEVLNKVIQNLTQQGFTVIHMLDLRDIFQNRPGVELRNYKILGVYNPGLAYRAITLAPHIGIMLPCNVVIQESENGEVDISAINPLETIAPDQQTPALEDIAQETGIRLRASVDFIARASRQPGLAGSTIP